MDFASKLKMDIDKAVDKLQSGLMGLFLPHLSDIKLQLFDLTKKQEIIGRELHNENLKIFESCCNPDLMEMFDQVQIYRKKLRGIKNKMALLHDKSNKLKKKSLKLEQNRQIEAKIRIEQREREERLIGKQPEASGLG